MFHIKVLHPDLRSSCAWNHNILALIIANSLWLNIFGYFRVFKASQNLDRFPSEVLKRRFRSLTYHRMFSKSFGSFSRTNVQDSIQTWCIFSNLHAGTLWIRKSHCIQAYVKCLLDGKLEPYFVSVNPFGVRFIHFCF